MTAQELLKPRYKLINEYPGCPFIEGNVYGPEFIFSEDYSLKTIEDIEKYPNVFERLNWWEERNSEDLEWIEYLMWNQKTGYKSPFKLMKINHERRVAEWNHQGYGPPLIECIPITKEEYEQFTAKQL